MAGGFADQSDGLYRGDVGAAGRLVWRREETMHAHVSKPWATTAAGSTSPIDFNALALGTPAISGSIAFTVPSPELSPLKLHRK